MFTRTIFIVFYFFNIHYFCSELITDKKHLSEKEKEIFGKIHNIFVVLCLTIKNIQNIIEIFLEKLLSKKLFLNYTNLITVILKNLHYHWISYLDNINYDKLLHNIQLNYDHDDSIGNEITFNIEQYLKMTQLINDINLKYGKDTHLSNIKELKQNFINLQNKNRTCLLKIIKNELYMCLFELINNIVDCDDFKISENRKWIDYIQKNYIESDIKSQSNFYNRDFIITQSKYMEYLIDDSDGKKKHIFTVNLNSIILKLLEISFLKNKIFNSSKYDFQIVFPNNLNISKQEIEIPINLFFKYNISEILLNINRLSTNSSEKYLVLMNFVDKIYQFYKCFFYSNYIEKLEYKFNNSKDKIRIYKDKYETL